MFFFIVLAPCLLSCKSGHTLIFFQSDSPAVGSRTQNSLIKFFSVLIINVWDLYNDI